MAPLPCLASRLLKHIQDPPASSHRWMLCACQHAGLQLLLLVHPIRPLQHASNLHKSTAAVQMKYSAILAGAASASARRTFLLRQSCLNIPRCRSLLTPLTQQRSNSLQRCNCAECCPQPCKSNAMQASNTILHVSASS